MSSFLLIFLWRRKLLILSLSLGFLISLWAWAIFYTASSDSIEDSYRSINDEHYLNKLPDLEAVKFVNPINEQKSGSRFKQNFEYLKDLMFDRDNKAILKTMEMPSRDEISRRINWRRAAAEQSHYEHELQRMGIPIVAGIGPGGQAGPNQRLVHLDLKGAPPKISYLKRLLPIMKSLGATGLLIEYEDMFPFHSSIADISAKNAYTKKEIQDLLHAIASVGLTIMPLIQTFGHLEFVLKTHEFQHLREVPEIPQSLCPSLNDSMVFLEEMITQVVELHSRAPPSSNELEKNEDDLLTPTFTHIHIGCDEVYQLGECERCKVRSRDDLFMSHVTAVSSMIQKKWPDLKVVIWDDMMRHIQLVELQNSGIGKLVEPMVWVYAEDVYHYISSQIWDKYSSVFSTAWTASAFKGANGEMMLIPPARKHLENNLKWLAVIQGEAARFQNGIQGIALTGWQRYDHFAVLCELFPVSLPSLALCLSTVSKGYFMIESKDNPVFSAMTCPEISPESAVRRPWLDLHQDPDLSMFSKCMFPGSPMFRFVHRLQTLTTEAREYINALKTKRGWLTEYNIRHNFSSPTRVNGAISDAGRLLSSLHGLIKNAEDTMDDIFDKWTISEFTELHIQPLIKELNELEVNANNLMKVRVWPRRPLPYSREKI